MNTSRSMHAIYIYVTMYAEIKHKSAKLNFKYGP